MIRELYVLYRPLGCDDESSTDEEQGEKVLYSYPSQSVPKILSRMNMLEGLIDFTAKFSHQDIDTVVLENNTWSFFHCEQDLWFICCMGGTSNGRGRAGGLSMDNNEATANSEDNKMNSTAAQDTLFHTHQPSGVGLIDALQKMYRVYISTRGSILHMLHGKDDEHMENINKVKTLRKKVRKLNMNLMQDQLDYEVLNDHQEENNTDGNGENEDKETPSGELVPSNNKLITQANKGKDASELKAKMDDLQKEILTLKAQISDIIDSSLSEDAVSPSASQSDLNATSHKGGESIYTPNEVRKRLKAFIDWYIRTGELNSPSALHSLAGMYFCPLGHPSFESLIRVRQSMEDASKHLFMGSILIYDGNILWSDLDDESTLTLYEFIRLKETDHARQVIKEYAKRKKAYALQQEMRARQQRRKQNSSDDGSQPSRSRTNTVEVIGDAHIVDTVNIEVMGGSMENPDGWLDAQSARFGFISKGWDVVDLDGFTERESLAVAVDTNTSKYSDIDANHNGEADMWDHCTGVKQIWCPRFYASINTIEEGDHPTISKRDTSQEMGWKKGSVKLIGRFLLYRQGRFIMCLLVPDWREEDGQTGPDFRTEYLTSVLETIHSIDVNLLKDDDDDDDDDERKGEEGNNINSSNDLDNVYVEFDKIDVEGSRSRNLSRVQIQPESRHNSINVNINHLGETSLYSLCGTLQRNVGPELERLFHFFEGNYNKKVPQQQAFGDINAKAEAILEHAKVLNNQFKNVSTKSVLNKSMRKKKTESTPTSNKTSGTFREMLWSNKNDRNGGDSSGNNTEQSDFNNFHNYLIDQRVSAIPQNVRAFYYNACNRVVIVPPLNFGRLDPLLLWPSPLLRDETPMSPPSKGNNATKSTLSQSYGEQMRRLSELMGRYRSNFPLSTALITSSLESKVVYAFNDLRETLDARYSLTEMPAKEMCVLLSKSENGGMWVVGKHTGNRYLYTVVEGCSNFDDLHEKMRQVLFESSFSRVIM